MTSTKVQLTPLIKGTMQFLELVVVRHAQSTRIN